MDPANPYGSILPWPQPKTERRARPRRVPGAWVLLYKGRLVLYMEKGGRTLWTFGEITEPGVAKAAFSKLMTLPRRRPHRLRIEAIDDEVPTKSPHETLLSELGFVVRPLEPHSPLLHDGTISPRQLLDGLHRHIELRWS